MDDVFKIYVEQLRDGREEVIREKLDPAFMEIDESNLIFDTPIALEGVAYLAQDELVMCFDIQTEAGVACSICSDIVRVPVIVHHFYASEALEEIKTGIYNFKNLLRETILLETPAFIECSGGSCPKRKEFRKYLKETAPQTDEEEGYQPFADLDWKG